jgi:hypothetical protein
MCDYKEKFNLSLHGIRTLYPFDSNRDALYYARWSTYVGAGYSNFGTQTSLVSKSCCIIFHETRRPFEFVNEYHFEL